MSIRISFLGDIAFVGNYNKLYNQKKHPFEGIRKELANSALVIGNLEAIAEGRSGENKLKKPRLKLKLVTLNYLKDINVSLVSLAHNHVFDNLKDGLERTINFLNKNKIHHLGAGLSEIEAMTPLILKKGKVTFGFLNYVTTDTNPKLPKDSGVFVNFFLLGKAKKDIKSIKNQVDFVIVLLHWGGQVEGGCYPAWDQPAIAKLLIQSGADLIVGNHSHTFQPYETIDGKTVFYSLGNFCFDDYYSDGKLKKLDTRKRIDSAIIHIDIRNNGDYNYSVKPIKNDNLKIIPNPAFLSLIRRRLLIFRYIKKNYFLWKIYYIYLRKIDPILFFLSRRDISTREKLTRMFLKLFKTK